LPWVGLGGGGSATTYLAYLPSKYAASSKGGVVGLGPTGGGVCYLAYLAQAGPKQVCSK